MSPRPVSDVAPLTPEMVLTQYGKRGEPFRNRLRLQWAEAEMSLILGRQTALVAALLVTRTVVPLAAVRYTTVGRLSGEGFQVRHSPTRGNPLHVSVALPSGQHGPVGWDDNV